MNRREFLAAATGLSSLAVAAGCTSPVDSTTPTAAESTTRTPTKSTTTEPTSSTTTTAEAGDVHRVWAGRSFTYLFASAHIRAHTVTGTGPLFVFAEVDKNATPSLSLGSETYGPATEIVGRSTDAVFYQYESSEREVTAFVFPEPVAASSGEVTAGNSVSLDDATLSKVADPPVFTVTDVTIPDSVEPESEVAVSVTVENTGGTNGMLRLNLTSETLSGFHYPAIEVPAGETVTATPDIGINKEDEETVTVDWGSGQKEQTVTSE